MNVLITINAGLRLASMKKSATICH